MSCVCIHRLYGISPGYLEGSRTSLNNKRKKEKKEEKEKLT
tara:strand:- start:240 stop:362 length:123 start_codon:yes stop_codon:yes gene_type:complete